MIVNIEGNIFEIRNQMCLVQQTLATGRYWEEPQLRYLFHIIDNTNIRNILIIGGHIGSLCIPLARKVLNRGGVVQVFEPHPGTFEHLIHNIRLNDLHNIVAYNYGVGLKTETGYFADSHLASESDNGHIFTREDLDNMRRHGDNDHIAPETVQLVNLDSVHLDPFDLVIMDVEGMEYEILQSAKGHILRNSPYMMVEIWSDEKRAYENMTQTRGELIAWMERELNAVFLGNMGDDHFSRVMPPHDG